MKITIQNGRVVDPKNRIDQTADVFIAAGKIVHVGARPADFQAEREIDATGLVVAPGLIDLCARPAPLKTELKAAIAGGITTLICPPDLNPPLDEPELVERLAQEAADLGLARLLPLGALTRNLDGERLAEMAGLAAAGCVAFSQGRRPVLDTQALLRAFEYAATFGFAIWMQPQDFYLSRNGFAHDGEIASRLGLTGIPVSAETVAIATFLTLAADTGVRLHLRRISSAIGMNMVAKAQAEGVAVTCDVGIHHLHLSEQDIGFFDTLARFDPPLRSRKDRDGLRQGVAQGVTALCSDHTPLTHDDKLLPFGEAKPGATGLELLLPLALQWGREAQLPLMNTLAPLTAAPAAILGRNDLGCLSVGANADLCLFAPDEAWQVTPKTLQSASKHTPFSGRELTGKAKITLIGGQWPEIRNPAFVEAR
ncbi:MAG: dihydroorotase [Zoogloeaceae bacterium]|jgi:dihydroorotase|nr:dihydroorotase [Zoogloeaceae bacterium]